jgi:hypothetical protein
MPQGGKRPRRKYTAEQYERAIYQCRHSGKKVAEIARENGVPAQTLRDHLKGKIKHGAIGAPQLYSPQEEKLIKDFVFMRAAIHRPVSRGELLQHLELWNRIEQAQPNRPKKRGPPGEK